MNPQRSSIQKHFLAEFRLGGCDGSAGFEAIELGFEIVGPAGRVAILIQSAFLRLVEAVGLLPNCTDRLAQVV